MSRGPTSTAVRCIGLCGGANFRLFIGPVPLPSCACAASISFCLNTHHHHRRRRHCRLEGERGEREGPTHKHTPPRPTPPSTARGVARVNRIRVPGSAGAGGRKGDKVRPKMPSFNGKFLFSCLVGQGSP